MSEITRPAAGLAAVTPSDTVNLTKVDDSYPRALWVGGVGNVSLVAPDDSTAVLLAVPAGTLLPMQAKRVNLTNTTATSIVALY